MRIIKCLIAILLLSVPPSFSQNIDSLMLVLESEMDKHQAYDLEKENHINKLLSSISNKTDLTDIYDIHDAVFDAYEFYKFDSALTYIEKNIQIAESINNSILLNESKLKMGLLLVASGRYKESIDILNQINKDSLPKPLINNYFNTHKEAYSGLAFNTAVNISKSDYFKLYETYKDSLNTYLIPKSEQALGLEERQYRDNNELEKALQINSKRLKNVKIGSRDFSLIMFERSIIHERMREHEKQKECLVYSAISDIQASVKDNASMGILAMILFKEGDLNRAHKYINFSYDDTKFYSSQLRFVYIANSMPLITEAYEQKNAKQKSRLQYSLIFITLLASFLLFAVYLVLKQMRKVSEARNKLKIANEKLNQLNLKLNKSNEDLKKLYLELSEVDQIKVHYIGTFLNLYSEYINKLDVYRKLVRKYLNTNQVNALLKLSESKKIIDAELEIFYQNFDQSFLHIYPNFISEVNKLLKPEKQIAINEKNTLNTELRILALIRLGISNSSRIAKILRYSVNTIYNYRAAVRKASIDKESFEIVIKEGQTDVSE